MISTAEFTHVGASRYHTAVKRPDNCCRTAYTWPLHGTIARLMPSAVLICFFFARAVLMAFKFCVGWKQGCDRVLTL